MNSIAYSHSLIIEEAESEMVLLLNTHSIAHQCEQFFAARASLNKYIYTLTFNYSITLHTVLLQWFSLLSGV